MGVSFRLVENVLCIGSLELFKACEKLWTYSGRIAQPKENGKKFAHAQHSTPNIIPMRKADQRPCHRGISNRLQEIAGDIPILRVSPGIIQGPPGPGNAKAKTSSRVPVAGVRMLGMNRLLQCPMCGKIVPQVRINDHLDRECLQFDRSSLQKHSDERPKARSKSRTSIHKSRKSNPHVQTKISLFKPAKPSSQPIPSHSNSQRSLEIPPFSCHPSSRSRSRLTGLKVDSGINYEGNVDSPDGPVSKRQRTEMKTSASFGSFQPPSQTFSPRQTQAFKQNQQSQSRFIMKSNSQLRPQALEEQVSKKAKVSMQSTSPQTPAQSTSHIPIWHGAGNVVWNGGRRRGMARKTGSIGESTWPLGSNSREVGASRALGVSRPLAERMRPKSLDDVVGQPKALRLLKPLLCSPKVLDSKSGGSTLIQHLPSLVLWGPPGVGKTTIARLVASHASLRFQELSAASAGAKEVRQAIDKAKGHRRLTHHSTLLFVDEIHRFNKTQQDTFLPHIESGLIVFIGATTENPSFELNRALLSRLRVVVLKPLDIPDLREVLSRALDDPVNGLGHLHVRFRLKIPTDPNPNPKLSLNSSPNPNPKSFTSPSLTSNSITSPLSTRISPLTYAQRTPQSQFSNQAAKDTKSNNSHLVHGEQPPKPQTVTTASQDAAGHDTSCAQDLDDTKPHESCMEVLLTSVAGARMGVRMGVGSGPKSTVFDLKTAIKSHYGIRRWRQRLIYMGKELKQERAQLEHYGISMHQASMHIVLRDSPSISAFLNPTPPASFDAKRDPVKAAVVDEHPDSDLEQERRLCARPQGTPRLQDECQGKHRGERQGEIALNEEDEDELYSDVPSDDDDQIEFLNEAASQDLKDHPPSPTFDFPRQRRYTSKNALSASSPKSKPKLESQLRPKLKPNPKLMSNTKTSAFQGSESNVSSSAEGEAVQVQAQPPQDRKGLGNPKEHHKGSNKGNDNELAKLKDNGLGNGQGNLKGKNKELGNQHAKCQLGELNAQTNLQLELQPTPCTTTAKTTQNTPNQNAKPKQSQIRVQALTSIARVAGGDGRSALNILELAINFACARQIQTQSQSNHPPNPIHHTPTQLQRQTWEHSRSIPSKHIPATIPRGTPGGTPGGTRGDAPADVRTGISLNGIPGGLPGQHVLETPRKTQALGGEGNGEAGGEGGSGSADVGFSKAIVCVTEADIQEACQRSNLFHDKKGDSHYMLISALHKSIRGSHVDASLYYLARMLEGGDQPLYIARRLIRFASEDVGMADPTALTLAVSAYQACHFVGMPECELALAQAVVYLAKAPKSVGVYQAYKRVKQTIQQHPNASVLYVNIYNNIGPYAPGKRAH
ncbi:hypothetical protein AAMO2058_000342300 [Amorphochlora amoebiformis]